MVWYARRQALIASRRFLKGVLAVSILLFAFFAYITYSYNVVLTSPGGTSYAVENFLLWLFIGGMVVTLIVIFVILYVFLHNTEHEH